MQQTKVAYLLTQNLAVIKLKGELRLFSSGVIEQAYERLIHQCKDQSICLDLTEAYHVDSTIFGTIAKLCLSQPPNKQMVIYYSHMNIYKQLENLGIHFLSQVVEGLPPYPGETLPWQEMYEEDTEKEELKQYVLKAHQTLAKICNNHSMQSVVDEVSKDKRNH